MFSKNIKNFLSLEKTQKYIFIKLQKLHFTFFELYDIILIWKSLVYFLEISRVKKMQ
ncbi:MAG: hypothetical protein QG657_4779 [Acidobacteriota bacterium]|nr:hypothetical protein [Acidobacteriota bacterium]